MVYEEYDALFLEEMTNWLEESASILVEAERYQRWDNAIPFVFRTFHSLKGAVPMAGLPALGKFLHRLEDFLAAVQNKDIVMTVGYGQLLLAAIDLMSSEIMAAKNGDDLAPFLQRHQALLAKMPIGAVAGNELATNTSEAVVSNVKLVVPDKRLAILYFSLVEDVQMPEVAAMVLENQYGEMCTVKSMTNVFDGNKPVIVGVMETVLSDDELKKIAVVAEVNDIYVLNVGKRSRSGLFPDMFIDGEFQNKLYVLLVDDDEDLLMLMWKTLKKNGYNTIAVTTAEEALQLLYSEKIHILITDIALPGLNGLELVKMAKERDVMIQVIIMTGVSTMQNAVYALEMGAVEYLLKPLSRMEELIHAVDTCSDRLARWWLRFKETNEKRR